MKPPKPTALEVPISAEPPAVTHREMIAELEGMMTIKLRTKADIDRRSIVFRAVVALIKKLPKEKA